jgi:predicted GTPase
MPVKWQDGSMTISEIIDTWDSAITQRLSNQLTREKTPEPTQEEVTEAAVEAVLASVAAVAIGSDAQVVFDASQDSVVV